jgi:segregation and condensation protein B
VDPTGALKNLLEKKLVRILGRKKVVGNPLLYGTTKQFLVHFGLNKLEDLPSIEEFDQFVGALDEAASIEPLPEPELVSEPDASPLPEEE